MIKSTTFYLLSLLLFPYYLAGQSQTQQDKIPAIWSFHVKYGIPLFDSNVEPTFSSFETSLSSHPRAHIIIGGGYRYFLQEKISLDVELSYEYGNFLRLEKYNYTRSNRDFINGIRREHFQTHSLLTPIKLTFHKDRISFSAGIVNTFHLASKVDINRSSFINEQLSFETQRNYANGDRIVLGSGAFIDFVNVDLERKISIQTLLGMDVRLNDCTRLTFEIRQYLQKNSLVKEYIQYDVATPDYTYYNPYPRTFSMGVRFDLKRKRTI